MLELILLVIRGVQAVFSIIVLGLTAYVVDDVSASRNNFLLFVSLWTLLALGFLAFAPKFAASIAHPFAILAVDAVTMVFWFAGFIAEAVLHRDFDDYTSGWYYSGCGRLCDALTAAAVFGAFNWVLFVVTTVFAALAIFRNKNRSTAPSSAAPMAGV